MYFITNEKFADGEITADRFGRRYFNEVVDKETKESRRVYIVEDMNKIKPNLKFYEKRYSQQARQILAPVFENEQTRASQLEVFAA